jgi:hypothetical protein
LNAGEGGRPFRLCIAVRNHNTTANFAEAGSFLRREIACRALIGAALFSNVVRKFGALRFTAQPPICNTRPIGKIVNTPARRALPNQYLITDVVVEFSSEQLSLGLQDPMPDRQ